MGIIDFISPKSCLGCGRSGLYLCSKCIEAGLLDKPICPNCYKPSIDGFTHTSCLTKFSLNGLTCVWKYNGVIKKALQVFKYKYATEVGKELADHFNNHLKKLLIPQMEFLTPIPIHQYKENTRGFNQSGIIGSFVAETLNLEYLSDLLTKSKITTPQAHLKGDLRRKNLYGVFEINSKYKELGRGVVLFDDVFTTGSTLKEAAKVLKRKGFEKVWGLTMCR